MMRGYAFNVESVTDDSGEPFDMFEAGLLMNIYDNGEKIIPGAGSLNFEVLTPEFYVGEHILELTYYRENLPEVESHKIEFYRENFTLPILEIILMVEILS